MRNYILEIKSSQNDQYFFVIKSINGNAVATSETYTTKQSCKEVMESIKNHGLMCEIHDVDGDVLL